MDIRGKAEKAGQALEGKAAAVAAKVEEKEEEGAPEGSAKKPALKDLEGVGAKVEKVLVAAGYDTVDKIKALTAEDLTALDGIGKKTAEKIIRSAKEI
jgi:predicted flap endonuclease-1-like 5' DNA nuclease